MTSLTSSGHWENEDIGGSSPTSLEWESTNGFTIPTGKNTQRHLVRGLNADGAGTLTATDLQSFRATTFEVCITATPGKAFASDTNFAFSYDGDVVPEPTSDFLVSLAGLGLLARRKRKSALCITRDVIYASSFSNMEGLFYASRTPEDNFILYTDAHEAL